MNSEEISDFGLKSMEKTRSRNTANKKYVPCYQKRSFDLAPNYVPGVFVDDLDEIQNEVHPYSGPKYYSNVTMKSNAGHMLEY